MIHRVALCLLLLACNDEPTPEPAPAAEAPAVEAAPVAPATPVAPISPDAPRVLSTSADRLAASHILVAYAQAMKASPEITRTREEARARAETLRTEAAAPGADFAALAKANSDDPAGPRGGGLGAFSSGKMVKPFEDAVRALALGEVSPVVETPFGFHVIRRDPVLEVHCAQIMIGFKEAARPLPGVTRSKDEAKARLEAARRELAEGGEWDVVVRKYTDGPLVADGGDLGWFGRRQLMPALDEAAFNLDIGAISEPIESPTAWHLLRRIE